jgi:hypothetical protein
MCARDGTNPPPPQKKKKKKLQRKKIEPQLYLRNPPPEDFQEKINSSNPQMEEALSQYSNINHNLLNQ